jgi:hypothetical protein
MYLSSFLGCKTRSQIFTSSGAWERPANVGWISLLLVGAGGGGSLAESPNQAGGGGGECKLLHNVPVSASSYNVTIGDGGAIGADGEDTLFGSDYFAEGGKTPAAGLSGVSRVAGQGGGIGGGTQIEGLSLDPNGVGNGGGAGMYDMAPLWPNVMGHCSSPSAINGRSPNLGGGSFSPNYGNGGPIQTQGRPGLCIVYWFE